MDFLSVTPSTAIKQLRLLHQTKRLMARRNTWSAKQGAIQEVANDEEYISSADIRKSIVLSMKADDEDWTKYRRRSSGGNATQVFLHNRSRRSSREDSVNGSMELARERRTSNSNGSHIPAGPEQHLDQSDTSCEDLLKRVTEKLDKLEMENKNSQLEKRQRRFGLVAHHPNEIQTQTSKKSSISSAEKFNRSVQDLEPYGRLDDLGSTRLAGTRSGLLSPDARYDISGQTSDNRFPWQRDQGVQCNMTEDMSDKTRYLLPSKPGSRPLSENLSLMQESPLGDDRPRSQSSAPAERLPLTELLRQTSGYPAPFAMQQGMVVMEPDVIRESLEFYAQAAADRMDQDGDPMQAYNRGRRSCVVPTLELGESDSQVSEESSESHPYPGDLVLHNGQALGHPSPPVMNGESADFYGSESCLATDVSSGSPPTLSKDQKKALRSKGSIFKVGPWKGKKTSLDLEYVLRKMKPTEFKNEQIANSRHAHWQSIFPHTDGAPPISELEMKRRNAVWEIYTTECTFLVDQLMVLKHCFMEPLKKCQVEALLMEVELVQLFRNLDELCDLSFKFCRNFYTALKSAPASDFASTECLCKCINEMTLNSRDGDIYHSYLLNYRSALTYLDILRNTSEDYTAFERHCEQDPRCNKLRLPDLLVAPMQHWTRLPLLLQRVSEYTTIQEELDSLDYSTERVVSSLKSLENKMDEMKNIERVKEIEKMLIWPTISEIDPKAFIPEQLRCLLGVQPTERLLDDKIREITFEGPLILIEKAATIDTHVFLFTDFLLFTKVKKDVKRARGRISTIEKNEGFYQVLRQPIPVESLSIHDIGTAEAGVNGMKHLFVIVQRNSFQQIVGVFTLQAHTPLGKENWLRHLRDNKEKTTEINNNKADIAKQKSLRDESGTVSHSNSLKGVRNSQVLQLTNSTSATIPRPHKMSLTLPESQPLSEENMSAFHTKPHTMYEKSRTLSTGCLNTDQSISTVNGGYFH